MPAMGHRRLHEQDRSDLQELRTSQGKQQREKARLAVRLLKTFEVISSREIVKANYHQ